MNDIFAQHCLLNRRRSLRGLGVSVALSLVTRGGVADERLSAIAIGSRRELFVDGFLIERFGGKVGNLSVIAGESGGGAGGGVENIRAIKTATSKDFLNWSAGVKLEYPGYPGALTEQLYTNQIKPYHRAPHILLGFRVRYLERGCSDSLRFPAAASK
jgi:hypothetical protein